MIWSILGAAAIIQVLAAPIAAATVRELVDGEQPVLVEPRTSMQFIALPGGCLAMADISQEVCVDAFAMGRFEVTNAAFRQFDPSHESGRVNGHSLDADEWPVANVSWLEANEFAAWLSGETGLAIRLPTEAEWEYAAQGDSQEPWFWGAQAELAFRFANLAARDADARLVDGYDATAPIASFDPNPFGLFDMLGNVSEWVADAYRGGVDRYAGETHNPLVREGDGPLRVRRGGAFDQRVEQTGVATRDFYLESLGVPQTGFRLVMELPQ